MSMQSDRQNLFTRGMCKWHGVPRTEEEIQIVIKDNGSMNWDFITEERRKYAEKNFGTIINPNEPTIVSESKTDEVEEMATEESEFSDELEILHEQYEEKFGKEVSNRYKNDIEWIKGKLAE